MTSVLVFSRTKHGADRIARSLERTGIPAVALHSNRSQNQRIRALNAFKSGAARVLVATDIAARGIDVDGISHVVNFDFPMHAEDYVHRIGRTGRAEQSGVALSFITPEDRGPVRDVERLIRKTLPRCETPGFDLAAASSEPKPAARTPQHREQKPANGPRSSHGHGQNPRSENKPRNGGKPHGKPGNASQGHARGGGKRQGKAIPSVRGVPGGRTWSPGAR
jgi:ATP-dependent RNA helicase RhlE